MNYYPHHIGDFNSSTRHLTRVERSLYRDLIELYYDTEQPLPADDFDRLSRRVIAVTDEEKRALRYVLDEFFTLDGDVYRHGRCDFEIEKYHSNTSAKAKAGKASAEARAAKAASKKKKNSEQNEQNSTGVQQPLNECATNQEPITKNQYNSPPNARDQNQNSAAESGNPRSDNSGLHHVANSHTQAAHSCTGEHLQFDSQFLLMARTTGLESHYTDENIQDIFNLFRCYKTNAHTLKSHADWLGLWRTWCQREKTRYAKSKQQPQSPAGSQHGQSGGRSESNTQRALRIAQQSAKKLAGSENPDGY